MSDLEALNQAGIAAEAVRRLNHATLRGGYAWPSDVDAVVAELHLAAARMDQALQQARRWLERAQAGGRVGHDQDANPDAATTEAARLLDVAATRALALGIALEDARSITAHLTGLAPTPESEPGL